MVVPFYKSMVGRRIHTFWDGFFWVSDLFLFSVVGFSCAAIFILYTALMGTRLYFLW